MDNDSRLYGMLCHLLALSGVVGVPLGHILGPLIIWLMKKDQYPFVDQQGKESLNFQITMTIVYAIVGVIGVLTCGIGLFLLAIPALAQLIFVIIASVETYNGRPYVYPFSIRFIV